MPDRDTFHAILLLPRPMKLSRKYHYTTDSQLVVDLLADDPLAIEYLLYDRFGQLLRFNALKVSSGKKACVEDLIHEFYLYLQKDNWDKLRRFDSNLPFDKWLSVVSFRFFKDFCHSMIDSSSEIPITNINDARLLTVGNNKIDTITMDIRQGISHIQPPRDREIIEALILHDEEPASVAARFGVTVDNLYNIKRRALARLIKKHLADYGKNNI